MIQRSQKDLIFISGRSLNPIRIAYEIDKVFVCRGNGKCDQKDKRIESCDFKSSNWFHRGWKRLSRCFSIIPSTGLLASRALWGYICALSHLICSNLLQPSQKTHILVIREDTAKLIHSFNLNSLVSERLKPIPTSREFVLHYLSIIMNSQILFLWDKVITQYSSGPWS